MYASPIASSASSPDFPEAASRKTPRVWAKQASFTARKSSFFEPKSLNRYGWEMPASRAIESVEAPCKPCRANSPRAASSTASRLCSAVCLSVFTIEESDYSLTNVSLCQVGSLRRRPWLRGRIRRAHDDPVRRDLPSGTVTFLFTDIEGSTKLLHELGAEGYAGRSPSIAGSLREAFAPTAASRSIRRATPSSSPSRRRRARSRPRPPRLEALAAGPIRVRMGIHTGTPLVDRGGLRRSRRAPGGAHRCLRPRRAGAGLVLDRRARRHRRLARPRRAPAQGPVRARAHLPARRRRLPAAQEPPPDEPARSRRRRSSAASGSCTRCASCSRARTSACSR